MFNRACQYRLKANVSIYLVIIGKTYVMLSAIYDDYHKYLLYFGYYTVIADYRLK